MDNYVIAPNRNEGQAESTGIHNALKQIMQDIPLGHGNKLEGGQVPVISYSTHSPVLNKEGEEVPVHIEEDYDHPTYAHHHIKIDPKKIKDKKDIQGPFVEHLIDKIVGKPGWNSSDSASIYKAILKVAFLHPKQDLSFADRFGLVKQIVDKKYPHMVNEINRLHGNIVGFAKLPQKGAKVK